MNHINKSSDEYKNMVKDNKLSGNKLINFLKAYLVGGIICMIGQGFWYLYIVFNISQQNAGALGTITMIFLGGLLTGIGVYDEMGQFAGAGTIVPVTGFANAMVSPAMEYKQEGLILGTSAKMYNVAGPVLTFGMLTAFVIGVLKVVLGG